MISCNSECYEYTCSIVVAVAKRPVGSDVIGMADSVGSQLSAEDHDPGNSH